MSSKSELFELLERAVEYVERFAELNEEPKNGDCRRLITEIRSHIPYWPDRGDVVKRELRVRP